MNVHLSTGAAVLPWIDSLSAYFPGTLVTAGDVSEAEKAHLFYTALWTRYSALPERWDIYSGTIEGGLTWWPGRPEFIESTYFLYRATKDPWYLYVGEMVLKDIKRRCWAKCGWAGLQDVTTGEKADRMESFFLSETLQYLFLLFDEENELHRGDGPWVFTTEGHPLIIPKNTYERKRRKLQSGTTRATSRDSEYTSKAPSSTWKDTGNQANTKQSPSNTCENPLFARYKASKLSSQQFPAILSLMASRTDIFHSSFFTRLYLLLPPPPLILDSPLVGRLGDAPLIDLNDPSPSLLSRTPPTNSTFLPWTLPAWLVPPKGTCAVIKGNERFELQFPNINISPPSGSASPSAPKLPQGEKKYTSFVPAIVKQKGESGHSNHKFNSNSNGDNVPIRHHKQVPLNFNKVTRVPDGVYISSLEGLRLIFTYDNSQPDQRLRIDRIGNVALGKDEIVYLNRQAVEGLWDQNFELVMDDDLVDLVVEVEGRRAKDMKDQPDIVDNSAPPGRKMEAPGFRDEDMELKELVDLATTLEELLAEMRKDEELGTGEATEGDIEGEISKLIDELADPMIAEEVGKFKKMLRKEIKMETMEASQEPSQGGHCTDSTAPSQSHSTITPSSQLRSFASSSLPHRIPTYQRLLPAISSTGAGSQPLQFTDELPPANPLKPRQFPPDPPATPFNHIYFTGYACSPFTPPLESQVIILKRGGCRFSDKINNIPDSSHLKLVVIVDYEGIVYHPALVSSDDLYPEDGFYPWPSYPEGSLTRPLLDEAQREPGGRVRKWKVPVVLVGGGRGVYEGLRKYTVAIGLRRRWWVRAGGVEVAGVRVV